MDVVPPRPSGNGSVGKVLIRCPVTGEPVYTGLDMDLERFENTLFSMIVRNCRICGGRHVWTNADAWLQPST
jgi:hypothetical protein